MAAENKLDILSIITTALELSTTQANKINDRKIEAARLSSEVAREANRAIDIIDLEIPRLLRRVAQLCPDNPEISQTCRNALETQKAEAHRILDQTAAVKQHINSSSNFGDWDSVVRELHDWCITSTRFCPWIESIIEQFDDVLDERASDSRG